MANKEYIERNALLQEINKNRAEAHDERCAQILEAILNASTADVVERDVFKMMLENAMAIPKPMHLYIYFADEHVEKHMVTRFSDLSQTKSQFYYYEESHHEPGKGKTFRRDEIKCFEVSFCPLQNWEQHLAKE